MTLPLPKAGRCAHSYSPDVCAHDAFSPGLDMLPASDLSEGAGTRSRVEVLCILGRSVPVETSCENPDPVACEGCAGPCQHTEEPA